MLNSCLATLLLVVCGLFASLQPRLVVAQEPQPAQPSNPLPLSSPSVASYNQTAGAWSIIHERARIEADGRLMRAEFNKWIGHSPARPNMNASYLSNGSRLYYIPSRGQFVNAGIARSWYW